MGLFDFVRSVSMARDGLDAEVSNVKLRLVSDHGWSATCADAFCFDNKRNYNRILHMRTMLQYPVGNVAEEIHRGAVSSGFKIR